MQQQPVAALNHCLPQGHLMQAEAPPVGTQVKLQLKEQQHLTAELQEHPPVGTQVKLQLKEQQHVAAELQLKLGHCQTAAPVEGGHRVPDVLLRVPAFDVRGQVCAVDGRCVCVCVCSRW